MKIRNCLEKVLNGYSLARSEPFTDHALAAHLRRECPASIAAAVGNTERYVYKGSSGQGAWARGPWIGIFDRIITTGAQRGYYPVYLFREDMAGVYLSLNQAMTEAKANYKADAKAALRARAGNFYAILGQQAASFPELSIDLAPCATGNDTAFYEAGNICAKYYAKNQLPSEAEILNDLQSMVQLYSALVGQESSASVETVEGDEPGALQYEDARRFRFHKRIERNAKLAKSVKKALGHTCQVCHLNFQQRYGDLGTDYIEAHHLKPLSTLIGNRVALDPKKDFAVLCANCHRMVHRSGFVDDIARFTKEHFNGGNK